MVNCIGNDEALYNLCKSLYDDGYKSYGAMICKLKEYGPTWKSHYTGVVGLNWKNDEIRSAEVSQYMHSLFRNESNTQQKIQTSLD